MDSPDAEVILVERVVNDPLAVGGGGGILGIDTVMRNLMRFAAVRVRHPDLEVAGSPGAPDDFPAVGCEGRIPVFGSIVGDLADRSAGEVHLPEIEVAAAVRGEEDRLAVRRVDRLAIAAVASGDPTLGWRGRRGSQSDFPQIVAWRTDIENDAPI